MKRSIFSLWFIVYGLWSFVYAQDETITLLTYYPAPYGVYQTAQVGQTGHFITLDYDATNVRHRIFSSNTDDIILSHDGTATDFVVDTTGNIGIGIATPTERLYVNGAVRIGDTGNTTPAAGTITWNGTSFRGYNGTAWVTLGGIGGSGNLNFIPKFTPDGVTLGNSQITDNGTKVSIGGTTSDENIKLFIMSTIGTGIWSLNTSGIAINGQGSSSEGVRGSSQSSYGVHGIIIPPGFSVGAGVYGESTTSSGVYGTSNNYRGIFGKSTNGIGVYGESDQNHGVYGETKAPVDVTAAGVRGQGGKIGVEGSGIGYNFYASGTGTDYGTFTGGHDVKIGSDISDIKPGMIVITTGESKKWYKSLSSTLPTVEITSKPYDNRVFGVFVLEQNLSNEHWYNPKEGERFGIVNSVGEGVVWVTDINGQIRNGDYITTSDIPGYGQKQDDDILHSYTLGKATEEVDWDSITDTIEYNGKIYKKYLIAVTYHCG